ncbi:hypothetical protein [Aeromicrobium sp. UC242_57]
MNRDAREIDERLRTALGEERLAALRTDGAALTAEAALALAVPGR